MSGTQQEHWDKVFATKPEEAVIIDVGAGSSRLAITLLAEGYPT